MAELLCCVGLCWIAQVFLIKCLLSLYFCCTNCFSLKWFTWFFSLKNHWVFFNQFRPQNPEVRPWIEGLFGSSKNHFALLSNCGSSNSFIAFSPMFGAELCQSTNIHISWSVLVKFTAALSVTMYLMWSWTKWEFVFDLFCLDFNQTGSCELAH